MKGLEIIKNGGEPLRIGADDGLLLVMFNHVNNDKVTVSDLYASVTEYATGDRYLYASEPLNQGDIYEVTYSEFNAQSSPIKLSHKGDKPISRPIKQDFIEPEYPTCSIDYKGYKSLKGFELEYLMVKLLEVDCQKVQEYSLTLKIHLCRFRLKALLLMEPYTFGSIGNWLWEIN